MTRKENSSLAWLISILFVVLLTGVVKCQHIKLHPDRMEWEDNLGIKFITVTSRDENLVYYYQVTKHERKISSLAWDFNSILVDPAKKGFNGCYLVIYCKAHLMAYVMERIQCFNGDKEKPPEGL